MAKRSARPKAAPPTTETYLHHDATSPLRPDVGTQTSFRKKKPPVTYRYDSSLSPELEWDASNPAREQGEKHIAEVEAALALARIELASLGRQLSKNPADSALPACVKAAADALARAEEANRSLKNLSRPFLNWTGKRERPSFDVPTLPLFVHERLSTQAIIDTLRGHEKKDQQLALFADPQRSIADQVLKAYEHRDKWVNRMILGDSMVIMNSLLHYESLDGQVQMIYIDPPYGVKFGSNFQPFVRKRDVSHNDDEDMTREPEMVQAYRDTWELGLHSYLTYLRDRFLLARELLSATGSVFVQISDDNLHHVRELLDEIFGAENFCKIIAFRKTAGDTSVLLPSMGDYLLWYGRDISRVKYREIFTEKAIGVGAGQFYSLIESPDGKEFRRLSSDEKSDPESIPAGWKPFTSADLKRDGFSATATFEYEYDGQAFHPGTN